MSYTSSLHLSFAHISSLISSSIHFSPLITTLKNNKRVSLLFNEELNISLIPYLLYYLPYLYIYIIIFIHFNYEILKCYNINYIISKGNKLNTLITYIKPKKILDEVSQKIIHLSLLRDTIQISRHPLFMHSS